MEKLKLLTQIKLSFNSKMHSSMSRGKYKMIKIKKAQDRV